MSDLISRQAAIEALMPIYKSASLRNRNVFSTARKCMVTIEELQSARPDNQINLCDSCDYSYPDCPSKNGDVIFGNNIGNDNICACNKYKPSAQPATSCSEIPNGSDDTISRQAAIEALQGRK